MAIDATVGGSASDSYVEVADYAAYANSMGWTLTGDTDAQEANLRRARAYLDRGYAWVGVKATNTQALAWPRLTGHYVDGYIVPSDAIPQAIKDAQCEMAYLIQGGVDPFEAITGGAVTQKREKVDVIEESTTYSEGSARDRTAYPAVDQLVGPYSTGKAGMRSGSIGLARA